MPLDSVASFLSLELDVANGAAWFYPQPKEAAAEVTDRVAFWKDVRVTT